MSLAKLLEIPSSEAAWQDWFFANRTDHALIRATIQNTGGGNLTEYILEPVYQPDERRWLKDHQSAHQEFNKVLNQQSGDIERVDLRNSEQLAAWVYSHYVEHLSAHRVLTI